MKKINFGGQAPIHLPVVFQGAGRVVYGLNVFPGEQEIEDAAWNELQTEATARDHILSGLLALVVPTPLPVTVEEPATARGWSSGEETGEVPFVDSDPETPVSEIAEPVAEPVATSQETV